MCGGQPSPPAPRRARDPGGSFAGRGCPGVARVVAPSKKRAFSSAAFWDMQPSARVFLGAPRSVKLHFPQECSKPAMLNVRAFPRHHMWLLRSTSSSKICVFVVFVYFLFSRIQYLICGSDIQTEGLFGNSFFISAEAVSFVQVPHSW